MPLRKPDLIGPRMKNRAFYSAHLRKRKKHQEWLKRNKQRVLDGKNRWAKNNYEKIRHYGLKNNYSSSLQEYELIWKSQGYLCAICKRPKLPEEKTFCLDHNHVTKKNRGILCHKCNMGIGYFKESVESLQHAVEYLEKWKG